jgi:hypothetical protein
MSRLVPLENSESGQVRVRPPDISMRHFRGNNVRLSTLLGQEVSVLQWLLAAGSFLFVLLGYVVTSVRTLVR